MKLKYKCHDWSGTYSASTPTHSFAIDKIGSTWELRIWHKPTLNTTSTMVKFVSDLRTFRDAKTLAQQFADAQTSDVTK